MKLEGIISLTLRTGVILSSILVVSGSVLYFVTGSISTLTSSSFGLDQIATGLTAGDPIAIILLGVVILILTPVLRVFELFLNYLWEKDRLYVLLSFLVFFFMVFGIVLLPILRA
ncbi:MAG: DUF1634 domain-containing protein [Nitrososphaerota archaeon]|nr:DUF1634 domain-containing protein [Nitrososphaerota archaeon]